MIDANEISPEGFAILKRELIKAAAPLTEAEERIRKEDLGYLYPGV